MKRIPDLICRHLLATAIIVVLLALIITNLDRDPRHYPDSDYLGYKCGQGEGPEDFGHFLTEQRHTLQDRNWTKNRLLLIDFESSRTPLCLHSCPLEWTSVSVGYYGWEAVNGKAVKPMEDPEERSGYALELSNYCFLMPKTFVVDMLERQHAPEKVLEFLKAVKTFVDKIDGADFAVKSLIVFGTVLVLLPGALLVASFVTGVLPFLWVPALLAAIAHLAYKQTQEALIASAFITVGCALWALLFRSTVGCKDTWNTNMLCWTGHLHHALAVIAYLGVVYVLQSLSVVDDELLITNKGLRAYFLTFLSFTEHCVFDVLLNKPLLLLLYLQLPTKSLRGLLCSVWHSAGTLFATAIAEKIFTAAVSSFLGDPSLGYIGLLCWVLDLLLLPAVVLSLNRDVNLLDGWLDLVQTKKKRLLGFWFAFCGVLMVNFTAFFVALMVIASLAFVVEWTLVVSIALSVGIAFWYTVQGVVVALSYRRFFCEKVKVD